MYTVFQISKVVAYELGNTLLESISFLCLISSPSLKHCRTTLHVLTVAIKCHLVIRLQAMIPNI